MDISVSIQGDKELAGKILKFVNGKLDLSKSMGASGLFLTRLFSGEVFASRGGVINEPWPALNDRYAVFKAEVWPGRPPLVRTGLMQRGFRSKSTALTTSLWNEAEYFDYHQEGRGVPERVMMKLDEQRAERVVKYIVSDVTTQMDQAGLI